MTASMPTSRLRPSSSRSPARILALKILVVVHTVGCAGTDSLLQRARATGQGWRPCGARFRRTPQRCDPRVDALEFLTTAGALGVAFGTLWITDRERMEGYREALYEKQFQACLKVGDSVQAQYAALLQAIVVVGLETPQRTERTDPSDADRDSPHCASRSTPRTFAMRHGGVRNPVAPGVGTRRSR